MISNIIYGVVGLVLFLIAAIGVSVLAGAVGGNLIHKWFQEEETYAKKMAGLLPEKRDRDFLNVN